MLEFAKDYNLQTALKLRLFAACFSEQKDISDRDVLIKEVAAVGLDEKEANARFENQNAINEIQEKELEWQRMGITSVPTVVLNRKVAAAGAQPVEAFKQFIMSELQAS